MSIETSGNLGDDVTNSTENVANDLIYSGGSNI